MITVILVIYLSEVGILKPGCFTETQELVLQAAILAEIVVELLFIFWKKGNN